MQEVAQADREQQVSQLQRELDKRQLQLSQAKEEEARLKEALNAMTEVTHSFYLRILPIDGYFSASLTHQVCEETSSIAKKKKFRNSS